MNNAANFIRCRLALDPMKSKLEFPERENATLLAAGMGGGMVLKDGAEQVQYYHFGFIRFDPRRHAEKEATK